MLVLVIFFFILSGARIIQVKAKIIHFDKKLFKSP